MKKGLDGGNIISIKLDDYTFLKLKVSDNNQITEERLDKMKDMKEKKNNFEKEKQFLSVEAQCTSLLSSHASSCITSQGGHKKQRQDINKFTDHRCDR